MDNAYTWGTVAVIALVTALIRFLPFWIFGGKRKTPRFLERLGGLLPYAIMGMLVVYCLKDVHFAEPGGFVPHLISCLVVAVVYLWQRKTLPAIVAGTLCQMFLLQVVF
ncbi:MAG: AzlD domain-containing protein [Clostridia bacterium]|nr:AzlD domain-containing protein [Clostridia bacterium]